ncbi:hypothetical protein NP233_g2520 [Leucocoprinus birnbaumii]|uniref:Tubulin nucleotide-binding domain-like protein n=1 Tax=Leucocoprinus birnbaumii TaxID=56174 RepID=A0AAD5VY74_9AGAR|nr:hypothetical protein NP233_g2520 [Leucocoprinus birnbaumii]
MREILYLQAGNYSNFISTHFWNTQDAYGLTQSSDENPVEDQVSFTERYTPNGATYYPRAIMFDYKENFGTLAQSNALSGVNESESTDPKPGLWDQSVDEIRQNRLARSSYHAQLEEEDQNSSQPTRPEEIRYWSDFSHVYYLPRSIQRVNRPGSGDATSDAWKESQDQFRQYNKASDNDLMDTSVRLFLEESDSIQGVHLMTDVTTFGGFSDALMVQLEDEFLKTPTVAFPILSANTAHADTDDAQSIRRILNEALYLRSLREHATLSIPISIPQTWSEKAWIGSPMPKSPYFSSSIIAAHVETVTYPLRMRTPPDTISTFGSRLLADGGSPPFAEISGVIPVGNGTNFGHSLANFTNPSAQCNEGRFFSLRDVTRGFDSLERRNYEGWRNGFIGHSKPETLSFSGFPLTAPFHTALSSDAQTLGTVHVLSRLSISNGLARLFKSYASLIDASMRRRSAGIMAMGIDTDDIAELITDLWTIHDSYPAEAQSHDDDGNVMGSDEE